MRAYSNDLRQRVVAACDAGDATREQVAARFAVSVAWIRKLLAQRRDTGAIAPSRTAADAPRPSTRRAPLGCATRSGTTTTPRSRSCPLQVRQQTMRMRLPRPL